MNIELFCGKNDLAHQSSPATMAHFSATAITVYRKIISKVVILLKLTVLKLKALQVTEFMSVKGK
ncbi:hypothetical protein EOPP23_08450 [Endozoicomonas sp. OPT23]|uniref:hypothetical protein n=1 Tax=Endozoicomonas sp. OPT23 TaxID=2072845 RepID=UPI00129B173E|nr:hypothetical protein [Endozoicomonas sp. OPT23]MRI33011.1 hypothetical protein [Endozoicomonas sp. OPT23]